MFRCWRIAASKSWIDSSRLCSAWAPPISRRCSKSSAASAPQSAVMMRRSRRSAVRSGAGSSQHDGIARSLIGTHLVQPDRVLCKASHNANACIVECDVECVLR
eukprot:2386202-Rhodomonas_salina.1